MSSLWRGRGRVSVGLAAVLVATVLVVVAPGSPAAATVLGDYEAAVSADSPLGWWKLDETSGTSAADSAGVGSGTVEGDITVGEAGPFSGSKSYRFDGSNCSGINLNSHASSFVRDEFSIEAWVKVDGAGEIFRLRYYAYEFYAGSSSASFAGWRSSMSNDLGTFASGPLGDGEWHHVVATRSESRTVVYVDGVAGEDNVISGSVYYDAGSLPPVQAAIGRDGGHCSELFDGHMAQVAYYGKALSATQVRNHYCAADKGIPTAGLPVLNADCVAPWLVGADGRPLHADPVDVATGALTAETTDLVAPAGAEVATVQRFHHSAPTVHGMFGRRWRSGLDVSLDELSSGDVELTEPDGLMVPFSDDGSGGWDAPSWFDAVLTRDSGTGVWTLQRPDGTVDTYTPGGRLASRTPQGAEATTVSWNPQAGVLATVSAPGGYGLTLTDTGDDGLVDRITASDGRTVTYTYQAATGGKTLHKVTDAHLQAAEPTSGNPPYGVTRYVTDGALINEIHVSDQPGVERKILDNTFDSLGRVASQVTEDGDEITFHYGMKPSSLTGSYYGGLVADASFTTVDHSASGDRIVYQFDTTGQVVGTYDAFGNPVDRTWNDMDPDTTTSRTDVITDVTYDNADRPTTVTETHGSTTRTVAAYTYVTADSASGAAQDRRLASSTDAAGVTTAYGYTDTGAPDLPSTITTPCDTDSTPDCPTSGPAAGTVTTTIDYSATAGLEGLPVSVTDPDGVETAYTYNSDRTVDTIKTFPDTSTTLTTSYAYAYASDAGWSESDTRVVKVVTETAPDSAETVTKYDAQGRVVEVRDPLHNGTTHKAVRYSYAPNGDLVSVTDQADHTTTYDTIRAGDTGFPTGLPADVTRVEDVTDPDGVTTRTLHDKSGDAVQEWVGDLATPSTLAKTIHTYGELGRLETTVDPEGVKTWFHYDTEGRLTSTTTGPTDNDTDHTTTTAYNVWGNVTTETGPTETDPGSTAFQSQTAYTYDDAGRVLTMIEASNGAAGEKLMTSYDYDDAGRQWRTVAHRDGSVNTSAPSIADGDHVTETRYTLAGRTDSVTTPGVDDPDFDWDLPANQTLKSVVSYGYDDAGRATTATDAESNDTVTTYDVAGRVDTVTTPAGIVTDYGYDAAGRRTTTVTPSGWTSPDPTTVTRLTTYTPTGQVATDTDPHVPQTGVTDPSTRIFTYTDGGRVDTVTDANGDVVSYGYDARGNRTSRTATDDASNPVVESWTYDLNDNVQTHVKPPTVASGSAQTTSYDYDYETAADDLGHMVKVTDPTGRETAYDYYGSGATKTTTWSASGLDTISSSLWVDRRGRVTKMADTEGTTTRNTLYSHDRAGQITEIDTPEYDIEFVWDLQGNQHEVTHPDGAIFQYTHLRTGQIDDLNAWSTSSSLWVPIATYTYDDDGRETNEWIYAADDSTRDWTYNSAGQLVGFDQAQWTHNSTWETYDADLTYNAAGRLATEQVNSGTVTAMTYDDAGQLVDQDGDIDYGYTYGTRGNRLTQTIDTDTTTYTTNPNGSVASATTGTIVTTYDYDAAGRRTEEHTADNGTTTQTITYDYDARGKQDLTTSAVPGQYDNTVEHHYDGNGTRWGIGLDDGYNTYDYAFPWDTTRAIPGSLGTIINGAINIRSQVGNRGLSYELFSTIQWFKYDARGSQIKPDNNTNVAQEPPTHYDPYGTPAGQNGSGSFYRSELYFDNIHLRNRDYDPDTGQFTTQDPLDGVNGTPTVANPYHYTDNDPHNRIDPDGLRTRDTESSCRFICLSLPTLELPIPTLPNPLEIFDHLPDPRDMVRTPWEYIREARNLPITGLGRTIALAHSGTCSGRSGRILECLVVDHPFRGEQVAIGNLILNRGARMTPSRLRHETKHADQWALLGPAFLPLYGAAELAGRRGPCGNLFEIAADLVDGGYDECA